MNSLESLSLETHEITSNAFDVVGDDVYIIIGTKNGNLIVLNTQGLKIQHNHILERPIIKIITNNTGNFIISDGSAFFLVDYDGLKSHVLQFNLAIFDAALVSGDNIMYCSSSGCYIKTLKQVLQQTSEKIKNIFQKQSDFQTLFKADIKSVLLFKENLCVIQNRQQDILCYNFQEKTYVTFLFYDFRSNISLLEKQQFQNICNCCQPKFQYSNGFLLITQHGTCQLWHMQEDDSVLNMQYQNYRKLYDISNINLLLVFQQQLDGKCLSVQLFGSSIVIAAEVDKLVCLLIYSVNGKLLYKLQCDSQFVAMSSHQMSARLFSQIPESSFQIKNENLYIITKTAIYNFSERCVLDDLIDFYNNIPKNKALQNVKQIKQLCDSLLDYSAKQHITQIIKLLEQLAKTLISIYMIAEASYVVNLIITNSNKDQQLTYIQEFLPIFSSYGSISYIVELIPQPNSQSALQKEAYLQIIYSLLINDYHSFLTIIQKWTNIYNIEELIILIQQTIMVSGKQKVDSFNPIYLKQALIYLLNCQSKYNEAFQYICQICSQIEIIRYVEEHSLFQSLFDKPNILCMLPIDYLAKIILICDSEKYLANVAAVFLQSPLNKTQKVSEMLESYLDQNYQQEQLTEIQEQLLVSDTQLRKLFDFFSILLSSCMKEQSAMLKQLILNQNSIILQLSVIFDKQNCFNIYCTIILIIVQISLQKQDYYSDSQQYHQFITTMTQFLPKQLEIQSVQLNQLISQNVHTVPIINHATLYFIAKHMPMFVRIFINHVLLFVDSQYSISNKNQLEEDLQTLSNEYQQSTASPIVQLLNLLEFSNYPLCHQHIQIAFNNQSQVTSSLTLLSKSLRNMIPIEYISKIDIAISTLDDLKIEFEFRKSCAEALCDDFFQSFMIRQQLCSKGFCCSLGNCCLCNQLLTDEVILMGCQHQMHSKCMQKVLKKLGVTDLSIAVCPICNDSSKLQQFVQSPMEWLSLFF